MWLVTMRGDLEDFLDTIFNFLLMSFVLFSCKIILLIGVDVPPLFKKILLKRALIICDAKKLYHDLYGKDLFAFT